MRILFVHQGYELYGSDRCFIDCVRAVKEAYPSDEIEVFVPKNGEIIPLLQNTGAKVSVKPLWILRKASLLKLITFELLRLPLSLFRAFFQFKSREIVYINTLVVLDYILMSFFFPKKAILHVHEVPSGKLLLIFQLLVKLSRATIIFNSEATKRAYPLLKSQKSYVIYNGIAASDDFQPLHYDGKRVLNLLILSRINRMKGQDIAIEAIAALPFALQKRVHLQIVGGVFGEDQTRLHNLEQLVWDRKLTSQVTFQDFEPNPRALIRNNDIIMMPSIEPETLGRVAIEAMAEGRPAIVSNIGGLIETVEDRKSGWHVKPKSIEDLKNTIELALLYPETWANYGIEGKARFDRVFDMKIIDRQIVAVISDMKALSC